MISKEVFPGAFRTKGMSGLVWNNRVYFGLGGYTDNQNDFWSYLLN